MLIVRLIRAEDIPVEGESMSTYVDVHLLPLNLQGQTFAPYDTTINVSFRCCIQNNGKFFKFWFAWRQIAFAWDQWRNKGCGVKQDDLCTRLTWANISEIFHGNFAASQSGKRRISQYICLLSSFVKDAIAFSPCPRNLGVWYQNAIKDFLVPILNKLGAVGVSLELRPNWKFEISLDFTTITTVKRKK